MEADGRIGLDTVIIEPTIRQHRQSRSPFVAAAPRLPAHPGDAGLPCRWERRKMLALLGAELVLHAGCRRA